MNPLDYNLDKEYRQRQMIHSEKVRQINEVDTRPHITDQLMQANVISAFLIIVSIIALMIFFASAQPTKAQTATVFAPGSEGGTSSAVYAYLYSTILAVQEDDLSAAGEYMNQALTIVPNFVPAFITHSFIALAEGDAELALVNAEIALEINPTDAAIYFVLAEAHFALKNYEEAQGYYETYLEMVHTNGRQPILITSFLNADSLPIVTEHLDACITEIVA